MKLLVLRDVFMWSTVYCTSCCVFVYIDIVSYFLRALAFYYPSGCRLPLHGQSCRTALASIGEAARCSALCSCGRPCTVYDIVSFVFFSIEFVFMPIYFRCYCAGCRCSSPPVAWSGRRPRPALPVSPWSSVIGVSHVGGFPLGVAQGFCAIFAALQFYNYLTDAARPAFPREVLGGIILWCCRFYFGLPWT